jgi:hypothetical protein
MNTDRKRKVRNHVNVGLSAVNSNEFEHISILVFEATSFKEISPSIRTIYLFLKFKIGLGNYLLCLPWPQITFYIGMWPPIYQVFVILDKRITQVFIYTLY